LERLRADTNARDQLERGQFTGLDGTFTGPGPSDTQKQETLTKLNTLQSYTPADLKDVNSLVTAMEHGDGKTIESTMAKYYDNPSAFDKLDVGVQLELERRGDQGKIMAMINWRRDNNYQKHPWLTVRTAQDASEGKGWTNYPRDFNYYK
jgi:hypothetical protein